MTDFAWQLEDGTGDWLLEDSGSWLLEDQSGVHAVGLTLQGTHATQAVYVGMGRVGREDPVEFTFLTKAGISFTTAVRVKLESVLIREVVSHLKIKSTLVLLRESSFKIKSTLTRIQEYRTHINTHPRPQFTFNVTAVTKAEKLKKSLFKKLKEMLDNDK